MSGPVHIAAAAGTPAVVIFGGFEHPVGSSYPGNIDLFTQLPCSPCWLKTPCPYDRECLRRISPEAVLKAAHTLWSQGQTQVALGSVVNGVARWATPGVRARNGANMNHAIIRVERLGKQYSLGTRCAYRTLGERLSGLMTAPWRRKPPAATDPRFWALRDVSFEVGRGEVVGIIGRNGAGKSTLLKILSRITEPTEGEADLHGRVGSLLEVGTGFHAELTGRENIFLNGAILGMRRAEIQRKFDEIVAFAEVESFIDTPVKHYSSGMYMRLAFAVAANLEPEILVVDEVLAVGDTAFQKRCLGKMNEVAQKDGRTVLFVSHNMAAIQNLCQRALLLEAGRVVEDAPAARAVAAYMQRQSEVAAPPLTSFANRTGNRAIVFTRFHVEDDSGQPVSTVLSGENITLVFGYECQAGPVHKTVNVGFGLHLPTGERLTVLYATHTGEEFSGVAAAGEFRCRIRRLPFNPGRYWVIPRIEVNQIEADFPRDGVGYFDVEYGDFYGSGRSASDRGTAAFLLDGSWELGPALPGEVTEPVNATEASA
jgi:lipopolysaccharide transport system ATP-binding protein